jgi:hypothetical protein
MVEADTAFPLQEFLFLPLDTNRIIRVVQWFDTVKLATLNIPTIMLRR